MTKHRIYRVRIWIVITQQTLWPATLVSDLAFKILTWLGYSNSAFNPIIYSIFNTEFREAFKKILTSKYPPCCGYQTVRANTPTRNDNFVTDYGTKTLVVRRSGSLGLSGVDPTPRSSAESVKPLRDYHIWQEDGSSNNGLLDKSEVVWISTALQTLVCK